MLLAILNYENIKSIVGKVSIDRADRNPKFKDAMLGYCKMEVQLSGFYFGSFIIQGIFVPFNNAFIFPNEFHLPFKFLVPWLEFKMFTWTWLVNYVVHLLGYYFGGFWIVSYLTTMVIIMNNSCLLVDKIILKVIAVRENFETRTVVENCVEFVSRQQEVNSILQNYFFVELTMISSMIGTSIHSAITNGVESFFVLATMPLIFSVLFVNSWIGSKLFGKFQKLSAAIYDLNWNEMTSKQRKDLLLTLLLSQKMRGFNGILLSVDLETFQTVGGKKCKRMKI